MIPGHIDQNNFNPGNIEYLDPPVIPVYLEVIRRNSKPSIILQDELNYTYSICDVQKLNFANSLSKDLNSVEIAGIAYCIGSIDIKPFRQTQAKDFVASYILNLVLYDSHQILKLKILIMNL